MKPWKFGALAAIAAVVFCLGCDSEPADACDYGQATTFSLVQPQQLAVVQQPVYAQQFAAPVYVQPFAVQRQVVRSYAYQQPQAVIIQEQRVRRDRDRGRSRQRVIVRQNLRY